MSVRNKDISKRRFLYKTVLVDSNKELDYLTTKLPELKTKPKDTSFIVNAYHIGRLDLVSQEIFDTPSLWWLIAHVNDIIDPLEDMYLGQELIIPSTIDYYKFFVDNSISDDIEDIFEHRGLK